MDITNRERNRYFYGKLLTVRDFELEQDYHIARRCLINRTLFGAGVACGLGVTASDDSTLIIESGMAMDYVGREILLPDTLIRKLPMLDGYEDIADKNSAYLCLEYGEEELEPVNAVGSETGVRQFNKIGERARLYLSAEEPDHRKLMEATGCANGNLIYQDQGLVIFMWMPQAVCSGEEFPVSFFVVKNMGTPPVRFSLKGQTDFMEGDKNDVLTLAYEQSPEDKRCVSRIDVKVKAKRVSGVSSRLFISRVRLGVEFGDRVYEGEINPTAAIQILADRDRLEEYIRIKDSFQRRCSTAELPIYLAKLELVCSKGGAFINGVTNLPFSQHIDRKGDSEQSTDHSELSIKATTRTLEYWQPPEVKADYSHLSKTISLDFGLPAPQAYDFVTAHGTQVIQLSAGMRVNSRYISDEIPHGLGAGNVDVRTAVEFSTEDGEVAELFGNSEVFKTRQNKKSIPWVETAVITYPERGTMRIGMWLHDDVDGADIKIHWFASRPASDSERIREKAQMSVNVQPEVARVALRGKTRFTAQLSGSQDKGISWSVKDSGGGAIDSNGIYQAPEVKGTYEIIATSTADPTVCASAFAIVE